MPEDVKRRVQTERREETKLLADTLEKEGTLDLDRLGVLIAEEKAVALWAAETRARSKNAQYASNMAKAEETAKEVVGKLRRAGKLAQNGKPKTAAKLLQEIAVTGSKVRRNSKPGASGSSTAMLYLEYLAAGDVTFQQWLLDGQPALTPPMPKARRVSTKAANGSSNRPEDY